MSEVARRVLVVDDEAAILRFLQVSLTAYGYTVSLAGTGEAAISMASAQRPDAIILDLGLPDLDGIDVLRVLREWTQTPVIVLSVRGQEADKIAALDAGADDYLTKPFGMGELLARLRAALRRAAHSAGESLLLTGELAIDLLRRGVSIAGRHIQLTPTEYELLRVLATHMGQVLTHRHLLRDVWGPGYEGETHMLRVNISNLRRKIEPDPTRPRYILTEPGVGYRMREG
jgi:two-component system KDP operon response regulator KdpE